MDHAQKTDALNGGRTITVYLTPIEKPGEEPAVLTTELVKIRLFPVGQYAALYPKSGDEMEIVAAAIGKPKAWLNTIEPESYELLYERVREVNKHFFLFAARQAKRDAESMNLFSPELAALIVEKGKSTSPTR